MTSTASRGALLLACLLAGPPGGSAAQLPAESSADAPCATAWTVADSQTSADLFGVAAGEDGTFVAVGRGGTLLASADGVSWTPAASGVDADLLGVTGSSGSYLAVGDGGTILASDDGAAWTLREGGSTARLTGVAWSGSSYVAVGAGGGELFQGALLWSPDGVSWSAPVPGQVPPLIGVTWDGRRFAAVGWVGALATSADGMAWEVQTLGEELQGCWFMLRPSYLYSVASSGSLLVAVGLVVGDQYPGLGVSIASADGVAWACRQTELPPDQFRFRAVAWTGDRFVAVGLGGGIGESRDGLAWTRLEGPATPTLLAVAAGPVRQVAVGEGGTILTRDCAPPRSPRRRLERLP